MAQTDDTVTAQKVITFTYSIKDGEGNILEQSDMPMSYIHQVDGKMYPSAEKAMDGKKVGDEVSVSITPEEGFGYPDPELMHIERIENVPPEYLRIGAEAMFEDEQGETITMKVTKIENGEVTLDANHPFAGKTVVFVMRVVAVRDATEHEIGTGEVIDMHGPLTMQ
ncbi:MAG: FKBP-type peptidyl-prolyl cis-trans isomerase [Thioalkalispiraceae bacterium]|jgi:FKBP-type peptidyl-prolyl cis-trans isomerase SlyD